MSLYLLPENAGEQSQIYFIFVIEVDTLLDTWGLLTNETVVWQDIGG